MKRSPSLHDFFPLLHPLVKATRVLDDDATVILVTWTVTDEAVITLSLEIQEGREGEWKPVSGASGLGRSTTEFNVTDLNPEKNYRFRMDMRRPGETNAVFVYSNLGMSFVNLLCFIRS